MAAFAVLTLSIRAVVEHETFKWNNLACNPLKDSSAGPAGFTREMVFSHVASCDASSTLYPLCQPTFDAALVFSLGQVADAAVKESGLDLGTPAADSIIAWRTEDGWVVPSSYIHGSGVGQLRPAPPSYVSPLVPPTSPDYAIAFNGYDRPTAAKAVTGFTYDDTNVGLTWTESFRTQ